MRTALACCSALLVVAAVNCMPQDPHEAALESTHTDALSVGSQPEKRQLLNAYGISPYLNMGYMGYTGYTGYTGYPGLTGFPASTGYVYRKRRAAPEEEAVQGGERSKRQYGYWGGISTPYYGGYYNNPLMRYGMPYY